MRAGEFAADDGPLVVDARCPRVDEAVSGWRHQIVQVVQGSLAEEKSPGGVCAAEIGEADDRSVLVHRRRLATVAAGQRAEVVHPALVEDECMSITRGRDGDPGNPSLAIDGVAEAVAVAAERAEILHHSSGPAEGMDRLVSGQARRADNLRFGVDGARHALAAAEGAQIGDRPVRAVEQPGERKKAAGESDHLAFVVDAQRLSEWDRGPNTAAEEPGFARHAGPGGI